MAIIRGTNKKNSLVGTSLADTIFGLGDDDNLFGLGGADTLYGGAGNDKLAGGSQNDKLYGEAGNDKLDGGTGNDTMSGGIGNDTYVVDAAGDRIGDIGGIDTVWASTTTTLTGGIEKGFILGTSGLRLNGNTLANTLVGNGGNNVLSGGDGNDTLSGGAGNDTLIGGTGVDRYVGGIGTDTVDYSTGNLGLAVRVDLSGGLTPLGAAAGETFNSIENVTGTTVTGSGDILIGDAQNNVLSGLAGDDTLIGGAGLDTLLGGDGDDTFNGGNFGSGKDIYNGGAGFDLVSYFGNTSAVSVNLTFTDVPGDVTASGLNGDIFTSIEGVIGGTLGDTLIGSSSDNKIAGASGNDTIYGGSGADLLNGDGDDDTIDPGDDSAADTVNGGAGFDTLTFADHSQGAFVTINGASGSGGHVIVTDTYTDIENVIGTSLADTINLDATLAIQLSGDGGAGNDTLQSLASVAGAIEMLTGGAGNDKFWLHKLSDAVITDFRSNIQATVGAPDFDLIQINSSEFGGMTSANIRNRTTSTADAGSAQFIYNTVNHTLWWDADGVAGGEVPLAQFQGTFATTLNSLGNSDFTFF